MAWVNTKTITGSPAEGDVYLRRHYINTRFWELIRTGEHILFAAPRRVGKSSVMKDLAKNCPDGYFVSYHNIESDKTQKEFFKRLFMLLLEQVGTQKNFIVRAKQWMGSKSIDISAGGLKLEKLELNYKAEVLALIEELGKEEMKVVIMLDEFPDVIQSIEKNESKDMAIDTLHTLRCIRQEEKFKNFSFVFAGSVGIDHVVASLDRPKLINDLRPVEIGQLTHEEANELISILLNGATMKIANEVREYLLERISFLLPYYIQLIIEKCDIILHKAERPDLTKEDIELAYKQVILEGRKFSDWEARLISYLQVEDSVYCIAILTHCAHKEGYTVQEAHNHTAVNKPVTRYKQLLDDVLVKDGYLVEENGRYHFLSPILREWWKGRYPAFEIQN